MSDHNDDGARKDWGNRFQSTGGITPGDMTIRDIMGDCAALSEFKVIPDGRGNDSGIAMVHLSGLLPASGKPEYKNGFPVMNADIYNSPEVHGTKGIVLWMNRSFFDPNKTPYDEHVRADLGEQALDLVDALKAKHGLNFLQASLLDHEELRGKDNDSPAIGIMLITDHENEAKLMGPVRDDLGAQYRKRRSELDRPGGGPG